jgi:membrane protein DedA with SNARE-associated domain/rhodanese-related sulfurtransferase
MQDLLEFVARYGYGLVYFSILIEQMGIPLPGVPILIVMGALARTGEFVFLGVVGSALAGSLSADLIWYQLGRRYGRAVLNLMCRISLEPDYCVRRAEDTFAKRGVWTLLFVKFIPGLNAAAVPLAGMIRIPALRFLAFDASGVLLWSGTYVSLGYIFSRQIESIIQRIADVGGSVLAIVAATAAIYLLTKYFQRQRFLNSIQVNRISVEDLKAKMDSGQPVILLDLRNTLDRDHDRVRIPGAFHMLPNFVDIGAREIKGKNEIVVYCSCPNEATSAKVAHQLIRTGLSAVYPLEGGLMAWRERGYPVESLD